MSCKDCCDVEALTSQSGSATQGQCFEKIPQSDRAKEVKDFNLSHDVLPVERTLGVHWNVERGT